MRNPIPRLASTLRAGYLRESSVAPRSWVFHGVVTLLFGGLL